MNDKDYAHLQDFREKFFKFMRENKFSIDDPIINTYLNGLTQLTTKEK